MCARVRRLRVQRQRQSVRKMIRPKRRLHAKESIQYNITRVHTCTPGTYPDAFTDGTFFRMVEHR